MYEVIVINGPDKGRNFRTESEEIVIGRDNEEAGLSLSDRSASRRHARIVRQGRVFIIEDLGSGNGTLVNAERIEGSHSLFQGDLIMIGKNTMRFHVEPDRMSDLDAGGAGYTTHATITMRDLQRELDARRLGSADWDELQRMRHDLAAVFRVGQTLAGMHTPDELYTRVIELVLEELPRADRCSLLLTEGDVENPTVQVSQARKNTIRITDTLYRHSLARAALQQQRAMLITDPVNDERVSGPETVIAGNIRSALCVPLETAAGIRGVLYADCVTESAAFDEEDLRLLSVISLQAAAAIDNARLIESLRGQGGVSASAAVAAGGATALPPALADEIRGLLEPVRDLQGIFGGGFTLDQADDVVERLRDLERRAVRLEALVRTASNA